MTDLVAGSDILRNKGTIRCRFLTVRSQFETSGILISMAKKAPNAPAAKIELYDRVIATVPGQVRKGAASAYTSLNGHMFSFVDEKGEFAFRYSEARKKDLMAEIGGRESIQYNSVMRGYVVLPDDMMDDLDKLSALFAESHKYISSLEPKPTAKKKK